MIGDGTVAIDPAGRVEAMGQAAGRGAAWMVSATGLLKLTTFVAQLMLGKLLSAEDFGLYAMALAATKFLSICQDGGVRDLLIQRGRDEYAALSGRIFWFALAFNLTVAAFIALMAPVVAHRWFERPELVQMLLVLALAMPLGTPNTILSAKLRLDLRFRVTSTLMIITGLTRQVSTVALALAAAGPMSFVIPAVICAVLDSAMAYLVTRDAPWSRRPEVRRWAEVFDQSKWLIFGSVANLLIDRGPYLVMQPVMIWASPLGHSVATAAATRVTGSYFWAYEMVAQIGVMLSWNLQLVLTPVFQRLAGDGKRLREAAVRAMAGMMLLGSLACLGMAVVMDPLEKVIFNGKWEPATRAIAVFGIFFPFRILYGLTSAVLLAQGRFRAWCLSSFAEGLAFTAAGAVAAWIVADPSASGLAWWTASTLAAARLAVTLWVMKSIGAARRQTLPDIFGPWIMAMGAATAAVLTDRALALDSVIHRTVTDIDHEQISVAIVTGTGVAGWFSGLFDHLALQPRWRATGIEAVRFVINGTICATVFVVAARALTPRVLADAIRVMPARLRRPASAILALEARP